MGVLYNAIQALLADPNLSEADKRAERLRLKVQAYWDNIQSRLPYTVNLDRDRNLIVHRVSIVKGRLLADVSFIKSGVTVAEHRAWWIPNPPILVPDNNGEVTLTSTHPRTGVVTTQKYRENILLAVLELARRTWK